MGAILAAFYKSLVGSSSTSNSSDSSTAAVYAVPGTPTSPATEPTGKHQYLLTFRWFTEVDIPSPTPSGL